MKQDQKVCAGCGGSYWPNQAWQHARCSAGSGEPTRAELGDIEPVDTATNAHAVSTQSANSHDDAHALLTQAIGQLGERKVIDLLTRAMASKGHSQDRKEYQRELMRKRRAAAKEKARS